MAFALHILAVGRARAGPERALFEAYAKRLRWPLRLQEVEVRPARPPARQKQEETAKLLSLVPEGAGVVALDQGGKMLASETFAETLRRFREGGGPLCFLIGGAEGLGEKALGRADSVLSLGSATWPHLLVRGLLIEQLYRAQQILNGHPYHRGGR
ncbi:MAG: 23S rRNA (pseudouridine(1915)-N(3))-methyltransferase RlmH [Pseudomonadota bacterium]